MFIAKGTKRDMLHIAGMDSRKSELSDHAYIIFHQGEIIALG